MAAADAPAVGRLRVPAACAWKLRAGPSTLLQAPARVSDRLTSAQSRQPPWPSIQQAAAGAAGRIKHRVGLCCATRCNEGHADWCCWSPLCALDWIWEGLVPAIHASPLVLWHERQCDSRSKRRTFGRTGHPLSARPQAQPAAVGRHAGSHRQRLARPSTARQPCLQQRLCRRQQQLLAQQRLQARRARHR